MHIVKIFLGPQKNTRESGPFNYMYQSSFFLLMSALTAKDTSTESLKHQGPYNPEVAIAWYFLAA